MANDTITQEVRDYRRSRIALLNHESLQKTLKKASEIYSFDYFALWNNSPSLPQLLHSYPADWVDHYIKQKYHKYDPCLSEASKPTLWFSDIKSDSQKTKEVFQHASDFKIESGYTIPVSMCSDVSYLTFSRSNSTLKNSHSFEKNKLYYHAFAQTLSTISLFEVRKRQFPSMEHLNLTVKEHQLMLEQEKELRSHAKNCLLLAKEQCKTIPLTLSREIEFLIEEVRSTFY